MLPVLGKCASHDVGLCNVVPHGAIVQQLMVQSNLLCSKMFQAFKMRSAMNLAASKKGQIKATFHCARDVKQVLVCDSGFFSAFVLSLINEIFSRRRTETKLGPVTFVESMTQILAENLSEVPVI